MQQVLEALEAAGMESRKVQMYLPDFLRKLREDLEKELKAEQERPFTSSRRIRFRRRGTQVPAWPLRIKQ